MAELKLEKSTMKIINSGCHILEKYSFLLKSFLKKKRAAGEIFTPVHLFALSWDFRRNIPLEYDSPSVAGIELPPRALYNEVEN